MPFWWNRRKKPWFTRWKRRRPYKTRRWRRRRRRPYTRRRRRRRRRRTKVRRKRQKIILKQWQPESITKCKIRGYGCLVAGPEGTQCYCYTNEKDEYPQPKAPSGGGFGAEVYSLQYLYQQWIGRRNIWTKSNDYKDLVRYTGSTIRLHRHPTTDFIVSYSRTPPFLLEKDYYNNIHPTQMLLKKHKVILPSLQRKPTGKLTKKIKIKPPRQMSTKWFFQADFAEQQLFSLEASACNLGWGYYGPNTQSRCITFYSLNPKFYVNSNWSHFGTSPYLPYSTYPQGGLYFWYKSGSGETSKQIAAPTDYNTSVKYDGGFFDSKVLSSTKVSTDSSGTHIQHNRPVTACRYNPDVDDGHGNAVWLISTFQNSYDHPKKLDLIISEKPLWLAFFGFYNFIKKTTKDKGWLLSGIFIVKSPAIHLLTPHEHTFFPIIDLDFIQGKLPWGETITDSRKATWYPTVENQLITMNNFVKCGPLIPKYDFLQQSSWELTYDYTCYFKWGGPYSTDQSAQNPKDQDKWDVPDTLLKTIQISDPVKQTCETMLRDWDYRRGVITRTALKRMQSHLQTDETLSIDSDQTPKKKQKTTAQIPCQEETTQEIQNCLLSLFEENTCQDPQNLQQLINQQQQQQQQLKHNLLQLLVYLNKQQRLIKLQTGLD